MAKTIDVELINGFYSAAIEAMNSMGGVSIQRRNLFLKSHNKMLGDIYAVIGLSDGMVGNCGISLSRRLAHQVGKSMFAMEIDEEELLLDAMGEIVNLIAGGGRRRLAGHSTRYQFEISPPTILLNHDTQDMDVYNPSGTECIVIECGLNDFVDPFMIELAFVPEDR